MSTLATACDGTPFSYTEGIGVNSHGTVFLTDSYNHRVCAIFTDGGVVSVTGPGPGFVDGYAADGGAQVNNPIGLVIDSADGVLIGDDGNHCIRHLATDLQLTTVACRGDPNSTQGWVADGGAGFSSLSGLALGPDGTLYISGLFPGMVSKIDVTGYFSVITTSVGEPYGVAVDDAGNLYVDDSSMQVIDRIGPNGQVTTLAGDGAAGFVDGPGTSAQFNYPGGVALGPDGTLYTADIMNNTIRAIDPSGAVSTVAGNGDAGLVDGAGGRSGPAELYLPHYLTVTPDGTLFVADSANHAVRKISR